MCFVNSFRIECTLFGNYVDELNVFLSSGEVQNVVVSIEFAKVKVFKVYKVNDWYLIWISQHKECIRYHNIIFYVFFVLYV